MRLQSLSEQRHLAQFNALVGDGDGRVEAIFMGLCCVHSPILGEARIDLRDF
jgi:hypothetical protein